MNSSMRRWSFDGTQSSALNSPEDLSPRGTCAATREGRSETSKDWIARIPDSPAISRPQTRSSPMPSGVTRPMPVTTTRLILHQLPRCQPPWGADGGPAVLPSRSPGRLANLGSARSAVSLDKIDRILDGDDLLGRIVRDLAAELLLERHHQLDRVETIGAEIVDKAGVLGDLSLIDPEMLDNDLLNPVGDIAHRLRSLIA